MIYLDNNATTKISPFVTKKMLEAYEFPLNSSASHGMGRKAAQFVEESRNAVKKLLKAENFQVIFTSGSSEANNMIIRGSEPKNILLCAIEHSSVYSCKAANKNIIEIKAQENGLICLQDLEEKISQLNSSDFLLCLMLANNETGIIQPVKEAAKIVHRNGGLILCDVVQAVGKMEVNLEDLNVDFASISSHKFNGPQGVGAALVRTGLEVEPLIYGGKQEKSKRAGTLNVAGITGLGAACEIAENKLKKTSEVEKLRNYLEEKITSIAQQNNAQNQIKIFGQNLERLCNTSYISIRNCEAQTQLINFDLKGICVSAGTTCSSGTNSESRVLKSMNVEPEFLKGAIRVSLSEENTIEEVNQFIGIWSDFFIRHINKK